MALVDLNSRSIPHPHEEGAEIHFRVLTGAQLRKAEGIAQRRALELARELGPEMMSKARAEREQEEGKPDSDERGDLSGSYDIESVVSDGLLKITGPGYPEEWKEAHTAKLDAATEKAVFDAVIGASTIPPA